MLFILGHVDHFKHEGVPKLLSSSWAIIRALKLLCPQQATGAYLR